jgi:hypothetical protein
VVFISGRPDDDVLVVRQAPIVAVPALAAVTLLFFWLSLLSDRAGNSWETWFFFAVGVAAAAATAACARVRTSTFRRGDGTVSVRDVGLLRRSAVHHGFGRDACAELVIADEDNEGDTYRAVLLPSGAGGAKESVELDVRSSFLRPSARIVMAFNAWMRAGDGHL